MFSSTRRESWWCKPDTQLKQRVTHKKGESGFVRVGIASRLGGVVSRVFAQHCKDYPAVNVECKDVFSSAQSALLHKREIDIGFLRPPIDQVNLDCELLFEEEFVVVLPHSHPLARRQPLRLKEIADEPLIIFDRGFSSGLYDKILGLYSRQGLTPHFAVTHVEAHEEAGAIMVASGKASYIGVGALVSRSVHGIDLAAVRLNEAEAKIDVYMAWRKDEDSLAVLSLLNSTRAVLASPNCAKNRLELLHRINHRTSCCFQCNRKNQHVCTPKD